MKLRRFLAAATAITLLLGVAATPEVGSEIKLALTAHAESGEIPIDAEHFPDENFREYVKEFDTDGNNSFSAAEIAAVKEIDCWKNYISSLEGIGYFTELTHLSCISNSLTELDLSKNTALTVLNCSGNLLEELNVSGNTALKNLECTSNMLTKLDLSKNTALESLNCYNNKLVSLNISGCTVLKELHCLANQLTSLDVSNNVSLTELDCSINQITSLDVRACPELYWLWCYDNQLTSLDISGCPVLHAVDCSENQLAALDVSNNEALDWIDCYDNKLISLDASNCSVIRQINCYTNQITSLDVTKNKDLIVLNCYDNPMKSLDISGALNLIRTYTKGTQDVLEYQSENYYNHYELDAKNKDYELSVPVSANVMINSVPEVELVEINSTNFPDDSFRSIVSDEFDVDSNNWLSDIEIAAAKKIECEFDDIESLDGIEYFTALDYLSCGGNKLTELDVSKNTALTYLSCNSNLLTELDVSGCTTLDFLNCLHNNLEDLDVRECAVLKHLYCNSNQFTEFDVSKNILLEDLDCCDNKIIELDISNCPNIILAYTTGEDANVWNYPYGVFGKLYKENGSIRYTIYADEDTWIMTEADADGVPINSENFPDAKFRQSIREDFDKDKNGYLSTEEAAEATALQCGSEDITSLKGIEYFTELAWLDCSDNQLTELDVSKNTALTYLNCVGNQITELDVSNNTKLEWLHCSNNKLKELNVSSCTELTMLECGNVGNEFYKYNNEIVSLDVSNNNKLNHLGCFNNKLEKLYVGNNNVLEFLMCYGNKLKSLDIRHCPALKSVQVEFNQITSLDISSNLLIVDAYNKGYKDTTGDDAISYDYYYGNGDNDRAMLVIDPNVNIITESKQQEIGTADVSGTAKNPKVDITDMGITFEDASGETYTAQVQADGKIMLPSLPAGEYTVTASLENCPSRDYTVKVESGKPVELDVELKLYGDVNGDGKASTADLSKINEQVQKLSALSDYDNKVADVNGDGKVTTSDLSKINEHVQQLKLMW